MKDEKKIIGDEKILMSNTDLGMEDIHRITNLIAAQYGKSMSKFSQDYGDDIIKCHKEVLIAADKIKYLTGYPIDYICKLFEHGAVIRLHDPNVSALNLKIRDSRVELMKQVIEIDEQNNNCPYRHGIGVDICGINEKTCLKPIGKCYKEMR